MIRWIFLGCVSFLMFVAYDINQTRNNRRALRLLFPAGILLLALSSVKTAASDAAFPGPHAASAAWLAGTAASAWLLIYSLFFAIPAHEAYVEGSAQKLCTTGVYGACRHPGVWGFAGVYFFLALFLGSRHLMAGGTIFTLCNIGYSWFQDEYIFPKVFDDYSDYRNSVRFLIPAGKKGRDKIRRK